MSIEQAFISVIEANQDKYPEFGDILITPKETNYKYFFLLDPEDEFPIEVGENTAEPIKQTMIILIMAKAEEEAGSEVDVIIKSAAVEIIKILKNNKKLISTTFPNGYLLSNIIKKNVLGADMFMGDRVRIKMIVVDCKYFRTTV